MNKSIKENDRNEKIIKKIAVCIALFIRRLYERHITNPYFKGILTSIAGFLLLLPKFMIRRKNAAANSLYALITEYIGMQGCGGSADMLRYGFHPMSYNGCEIIAMYDILKYLSEKYEKDDYFTDIRDIASSCMRKGSVLLGGFGTAPGYIFKYLREKLSNRGDFEIDIITDSEYVMDAALVKSDAAIFTYWQGRALAKKASWIIHTVMISNEKTVRIYNLFSNTLYTERYQTIASLVADMKISPISLITATKKPINSTLASHS